MSAPSYPDLSNVILPFTPVSYWVAGTFDPACLIAALEQQPALAVFPDAAGNLQGAVRLDPDIDPSNVGWWVSVPDTAGPDAVQAGVAAYVAPPTAAQIAAEPATAVDHAAASDAIITEKLASVPIPRDQIATILHDLLNEAAAAIPFFEKYALDPSMTGAQWAAFQQIPLTTTDGSVSIYRLIYDTLRSLAALLRYLTGDLPTS